MGLVAQMGRLKDAGINQTAWEAFYEAKPEGLSDKTGLIEMIASRG